MRDKIKAAAVFLLAYLNTPTSKVGIVAILTGAAGKWLTPLQIEALYWSLMIGAGVALVLYPQEAKK